MAWLWWSVAFALTGLVALYPFAAALWTAFRPPAVSDRIHPEANYTGVFESASTVGWFPLAGLFGLAAASCCLSVRAFNIDHLGLGRWLRLLVVLLSWTGLLVGLVFSS